MNDVVRRRPHGSTALVALMVLVGGVTGTLVGLTTGGNAATLPLVGGVVQVQEVEVVPSQGADPPDVPQPHSTAGHVPAGVGRVPSMSADVGDVEPGPPGSTDAEPAGEEGSRPPSDGGVAGAAADAEQDERQGVADSDTWTFHPDPDGDGDGDAEPDGSSSG